MTVSGFTMQSASFHSVKVLTRRIQSAGMLVCNEDLE